MMILLMIPTKYAIAFKISMIEFIIYVTLRTMVLQNLEIMELKRQKVNSLLFLIVMICIIQTKYNSKLKFWEKIRQPVFVMVILHAHMISLT